MIDRGELHLVEQRGEDEGYGQLSSYEAKHHLQVAHLTGPHHARHGDEGHARDAGTYHGKGHHVPLRLPASNEEACIIGLPACKVRHGEKYGEVYRYGQYRNKWGHFLIMNYKL